MKLNTIALAAAGLLAAVVPMQVAAQDTQSTTTSVDRADEEFNLGWLGLLGLAGLLGLRRRDNNVHTTTGTTNRA